MIRIAWSLVRGGLALLLALACTWPCGLRAGSPESSLRPALRLLGEAEGLHDMTIYGLAQDLEGRLWVGTQNGVAVFSGQRFHRVAFPGPHQPSVVRGILATADGSVWFATDNLGLFRKQGTAWTHFTETEGLPSRRVNAVAEVVRGGRRELYVGTTRGLARLEGESWVRVEPGGRVPPGSWIWRVEAGPQGELGVAARGWVGVARDRGWEVHDVSEGLPGPDANGLAWIDGPGGPRLCVTIWNKGVFQREGNRWTTLEAGPRAVNPTGLLRTQDPLGREIVWVATFNEGLYWRWQGQWRHLDVASGFPGNGVYSLSSGGKPSVWVGTRGEGLVGVDLAGWATLPPDSGMPRGEVTAVWPTVGADGRPRIWAGTPQGVFHGQEGRWTRESLDGSGADYVNAFAETEGGRAFWVATMRGLLCRRNGRWTRLDPRTTTGDAQVFCLLATRDAQGHEVLWAGTQEGLGRLRDGVWSQVEGLPNPYLLALAETTCPEGERDLWFGTRGQGLGRCHRGRWQLENEGLEDLPGLVVTCLEEVQDPGGGRWLWAGTVGGGLLRRALDGGQGRWTRYPPGHFPGLQGGRFTALRRDGQGGLFAVADSGVAHFRVRSGGDLELVRLFTRGDGLPSHAATAGTLAWDRSGHLWFGSSRGLARYTPLGEPPLPPLPTLLVDREAGEGELAPLAGALRLGYRANRLKVRLGLPILHRLEDTRFQTQLVGAEAEPSPWTADATRDFSALPPGDLVLRVWGRDFAGRVTPPRDLPLHVEWPPWRRPWAVAAYGVTALLLVWGLLALRTRLLTLRNRELSRQIREATAALEAARDDLERRVQARTQDLGEALGRAEAADRAKSAFLARMSHELRTPLNHMLLYAQVLEAELPDGPAGPDRGAFAAIHTAGRDLERLIADILAYSDLEAGHLEPVREPFSPRTLLERVAGSHRALARAKGLTLEVEAEGLPARLLGDEAHLGRVLEDLVSNALKFTAEGGVRLRGRWRAGSLRVEVEDTGIGIAPESAERVFRPFEQEFGELTRAHGGTGLGLALAQRTLEALGGRLGFQPLPGGGTCFWLELPVPEA